mmetsp:Transcript_54532/g.130072  ORF Transcript_54532/g.130072 Transcript_54532/m.130072 type:complete len:374 (+) Transcript_54532:330-1451(+)
MLTVAAKALDPRTEPSACAAVPSAEMPPDQRPCCDAGTWRVAKLDSSVMLQKLGSVRIEMTYIHVPCGARPKERYLKDINTSVDCATATSRPLASASNHGSTTTCDIITAKPMTDKKRPSCGASHAKAACIQRELVEENMPKPRLVSMEAEAHQTRTQLSLRRSLRPSKGNTLFKPLLLVSRLADCLCEASRYSGRKRNWHTTVAAARSAAKAKGTPPPNLFATAPPMAGPSTRAPPMTVKNLPMATALCGPALVESAIQLASTAPPVAKSPPTTCTAARTARFGAIAIAAVSATKAQQLQSRTGLLPAVSDKAESVGAAKNSARCRSAAMLPRVVAAESTPKPSKVMNSLIRSVKAGNIATAKAVMRRNVTR